LHQKSPIPHPLGAFGTSISNLAFPQFFYETTPSGEERGGDEKGEGKGKREGKGGRG